jgi:hypothetical protein
MIFGESRNKQIDDLVIEEVKQGPSSMNITDINIEAPKSLENEEGDGK